MASFDMTSAVGMAGQGAATGTAVMPGYGTAIGAGAGFLLGGVLGGKASEKDRKLRKLQEAYLAEMLQMARRMKDEGGAMLDQYAEYFRPIETLLAQQALKGEFAAPEHVRQDYMDRASANIIHSFNKQRQITERNMRASGVDPSEVGALEAQRKMAGTEALSEGLAVNQAARQADLDVTAGRFKTTDLGNRIFQGGMDAFERGYGGISDQAAYTQGQRNANFNRQQAMASSLAKSADAIRRGYQKKPGDTSQPSEPPAYLTGLGNSYTMPNENLISYDPRRGYTMDVEGAFMGGVPRGYADGGDAQNPMMGATQSPMGGAVNGPGGPVDDQIHANLPPNSYVIPADVVEALGVEFFDKIEMQNSGQAGAQGAQGRANALLSNGEYVISPQTVQRKGKKFFDDLIAKYHKPAAEQSEEYQQENQGAEPGEAQLQFDDGGPQKFAEGGQMGYFGQYDPMQRTQVGAQPQQPMQQPQQPAIDPARLAELQQKWEQEQSGGQQMSMEELEEYNAYMDMINAGKADGGEVIEAADGYYSPEFNQYTSEFGKDPSDYFTKAFEFDGQTYGGYDRDAAMRAANPQWQRVGKNTYYKAASKAPEMGVFNANKRLYDPQNRIALWKAKRANMQGQRQQSADLDAYTPIGEEYYKRKKKSGLGRVISKVMRYGDPFNVTGLGPLGNLSDGLRSPYKGSKRPAQGPGNPLAPVISGMADGGPVGRFDPEGDGYDYETAEKHGMLPKEGEHGYSREPETGQVLKGRRHDTFHKAIREDRKLGYSIAKHPDGKYYSTRDAEGGPTDGELRRMPPEAHPYEEGRDPPFPGRGAPKKTIGGGARANGGYVDGAPSPEKAKEMLSHGEVHGQPLSEAQRGYFGAVAGGNNYMADGGPTSPDIPDLEIDNAQPDRIKDEVERIADKYKKTTTEKKADGGSVTVEEEYSFAPKKKTRRGGRKRKKLGKFGK